MDYPPSESKIPSRGRMSQVATAVFRVLFMAVLLTGLGMALGLFAGILIQVFRSISGGVDMTVAYRRVAFPVAAVSGVLTLIAGTIVEFRTARRSTRR